LSEVYTTFPEVCFSAPHPFPRLGTPNISTQKHPLLSDETYISKKLPAVRDADPIRCFGYRNTKNIPWQSNINL